MNVNQAGVHQKGNSVSPVSLLHAAFSSSSTSAYFDQGFFSKENDRPRLIFLDLERTWWYFWGTLRQMIAAVIREERFRSGSRRGDVAVRCRFVGLHEPLICRVAVVR